MAAPDLYTVEDAERDIADLRGLVDRTGEILSHADSTQAPNQPSAGYALFSTSGYPKAATSNPGDTSAYSLGCLHVSGEPAQTINSLAATAITGASAPVGAGKYILDAVIFCTNGATNANQGIAVGGPAVTVANIKTDLDDTTTGSTVIRLGSSQMTGTGQIKGVTLAATLITNAHTFTFWLRGYVTFSASGTFTLQAACITAAADTFTVNAFELDLSPAI